jgi:Tfp pilus assembly protein PilN
VALVGAGTGIRRPYLHEQPIEHQESRNQMLQSEIRVLDRQIARIRELDRQRQNVIDRIEVIQTLQASRPEAVHLFDQMVRTLPEGTYFGSCGRRASAFGWSGEPSPTRAFRH